MQNLIFSNDGKKVRGVRNKNLSYVEIPHGVTEIDSYAFYCCRSLKEIIIPETVKRIGSYAFDSCCSLENILIPDGVELIEKDAFHSCENIKSLNIPQSVTSIGDGAFAYCKKLVDVKIPRSVQEIGEYAFSDTEWFGKQEYGVIYINDILYRVKGICPKSVIIRDGTKSISDGAFAHCSTLQNITIPNSVTSIGYHSFEGCSSLESLIIPNSIKEIGGRAFAGCKSLKEIHITDNLSIVIGGDSFEGTRWLMTQNEAAIYINDILYKFKSHPEISSIVIKSGTRRIAPLAFSDCTGIQNISIPDSVQEIGWGAFKGCQSLKSVKIPKGIKEIEDGTFRDCTSLEEIDIPNSVTTIGDNAFINCSSLQTIDIPNSVVKIGKSAFSGCSSLFSIDLPDSVLSVEDEALEHTKWYEDSPSGVIYLNKVLYKVKGNVDDAYLVIRDGTRCIADRAFSENDKFANLEIPRSLRAIGKFSFWQCKFLKTIHSKITNVDELHIDAYSFNSDDVHTISLYVPSGTRWEYRHHPFFSQFADIKLEEMTKER